MRGNLRQYRQDTYRLRNHPQAIEGFVDSRDSFVTVYLTLFPFLAAEYFVERSYDAIPSGLVFPLGYLLFWAFYYTYYKPGFLEEHLSDPHRWDLGAVPALFLGVMIWFMKVTFVELSHLVVLRWFLPKTKPAPRPAVAQPRAGRESERPRPEARAKQSNPPRREVPWAERSSLSLELIVALQMLGLTESSSWTQIHKKYRELAKQFHPDLNRGKTDHGHRFIQIDQAYRRLEENKKLFRP